MSEQPRIDINEVLAAQAVHEEAERAEKEAESARLKHEEDLKNRAGEDYALRTETMATLRTKDQERSELVNSGIEHKIDRQDEVVENITSREEQLRKVQKQLAELGANIGLLTTRAKSAEQEGLGLAPALSQALQDLQNQQRELTSESEAFITDLEAMRQEQVSDQQVQHYHALLVEIAKLADEMGNIEQNPALLELLRNEAEVESALVQQFVGIIEQRNRSYRHSDDDRTAFLNTLCRRFFEEELEHRHLNDLPKPSERIQAMRALATNLEAGLKQAGIGDMINDHNNGQLGDHADEQLAGLALANLAGIHGTGDAFLTHGGNIGLPSRFGREHSQEIDRLTAQPATDYVKVHLGSINYVKALADGFEYQVATDVIGNAKGIGAANDRDWAHNELGMLRKNSPILPTDLPPAQAEKIRDRYNQDRERAQAISKKRLEDEITSLNNQLGQLETNAAEVKQYEVRLANAQREYESMGGYNAQYDFDSQLRDIEYKIGNLNGHKKDAQRRLVTANIFSRKRIQIEISKLDGDMKSNELRKQNITQTMERFQAVDAMINNQHLEQPKQSIYALRSQITDIKDSIRYKTESLAKIDREAHELVVH